MNDGFRPKVSIVIPVYNGANYMRDAIDSALAQTYSNIEVLVINDGSKDNGETDRIAKSYGNRIRYFSKPNGGVATALNFGIEKMEGDYFSWLSHDDMYMPDKVKAQIELLDILKDKDTVIYSGYNLMNESGKVYETIDFLSQYSQKKLDTPIFNVLKGLANGCTMLIPRKYFTVYGSFDPSLPTTQDYELWFRMFRNVPVKYSNKINVNMRQHANQGSKVINTHVDECNELWISFLKRITVLEMCRIDETPELFLKRTREFLEKTPYKDAYKYCCELENAGFKYDTLYDCELVNILCNNYNDLYFEYHKNQNCKQSVDTFHKVSLWSRFAMCIKENGIIYTMRKIVKKVFG